MSRNIWFRFYMDRWIAGTDQLGQNPKDRLFLKGAYLELLLYLYYERRPIKDVNHIARILHCNPRTARRIWSELGCKFVLNSNGIQHKVVTEISRKRSEDNDIEVPHFHPLDLDLDLKKENPSSKGKRKKAPGGATSPAKPAPPPDYPSGLNVDAWNEYLEHRRQLKLKPYTRIGAERKMTWLANQGDAATQAAVVDQTLSNNWTGLFELKDKGNGRDNDENPNLKPADLSMLDDDEEFTPRGPTH